MEHIVTGVCADLEDNICEIEIESLYADFSIDGKPINEFFNSEQELIKTFKSFPVDKIDNEIACKMVSDFIKDLEDGWIEIEDTKVNFYTIFNAKIKFEFEEGCEQTWDSPGEPAYYVIDWAEDMYDMMDKISTEISTFLNSQDIFKDKNVIFKIDDDLCWEEFKLYRNNKIWWEDLSDDWMEELAYKEYLRD